MASGGTGTTNIGPDWSFLTPEILDPSSTTLAASGLSKEQYHFLSLVWIEVRRLIILLGECSVKDLGVDSKARNEYLKGALRLGDIFPERVAHDFLTWETFPHIERVPYSDLEKGHEYPTRWDHLKTTIDKKEKIEGKGEIGLWVRWTSAANNIYLSRLWEMGFGGLKYDVPLRTVHKYYMLQLEVNDKEPIVLTDKSKKKSTQQENTNSTDAYLINGDASFRGKYTLDVPLASKRFPGWLNPSMFWGMLQLYWYRNIRTILNLHIHLPPRTRYTLDLIMDRISVYLDSYCRASGFSCRENNYINFTPQERSSLGNLSQASRKPDPKPRDPFQWWKDFIICTPDVEMHDFDFMFAQFLSDEHQVLRDQQYAMQFHARAAYLTRVWGQGTHDIPLRSALESVAGMSFEIVDGFEFNLNSQTYGDLEISGLKEYLADEKAMREKLDMIFRAFEKWTAQGLVTRDNLRHIYILFAFMFAALDKLRSAIVQFIDATDDLLVQDEMEAWDSSGRKTFTPPDITRFWLDVASQNGYISLNETNVGFEPEDKWREHQTKLNTITTKQQKVTLWNKQVNRDRIKRHLPQRARRHTIEFLKNKKIDYEKSVRDYADIYFEYQASWSSPENTLTYYDDRVEAMRALLLEKKLSTEGGVGELRERMRINNLMLKEP